MEGGQATGFVFSDLHGTQRRVTARKLVLACGGIENSRLLLHFNAQTHNALVPVPQSLGRYWMEHPHFGIGTVAYFSSQIGQQYFSLLPHRIRQEQILNCALRVWVRDGALPQRYITELFCDFPGLSRKLMARSPGLRQFECFAALRAAWEQEPRHDNHIALDPTDTDRFGIPRPVLHWTFSDLDRRTALRTATAFGEHVAREHLGRVRVADWLRNGEDFPHDDEIGGYHHMGGTRMSAEPALGVVDRNLRLWGQEHFHVAGSSVFPTGGHANPTLTITQLSLRLADHLAATLRG